MKIGDFVCPKCGEKLFKTTTEPKTYEELFDAMICLKCGCGITKDDVRRQALDVLDEFFRKSLSEKVANRSRWARLSSVICSSN